MAILVQYRVKAERAEENEAFIRRVFESLHENKPNGVRYASFKAADGVSFTHLAIVDTDDGHNPLVAMRAFQQFVADIGDRCESPPQTTQLVEVGAYRMLGHTQSPC